MFLVKTGGRAPVLQNICLPVFSRTCGTTHVQYQYTGSLPSWNEIIDLNEAWQPFISKSTKQSFPIYFSREEDISHYLCNLTGEYHGFTPEVYADLAQQGALNARVNYVTQALTTLFLVYLWEWGTPTVDRQCTGYSASMVIGWANLELQCPCGVLHQFTTQPINAACTNFWILFLIKHIITVISYTLIKTRKCVMFGVTHVLAIDGYSRKIVGFIAMPKKTYIWSSVSSFIKVFGTKSVLTMVQSLHS